MIQAYLKYQRGVKNLTPRTLQEYRKELRMFATWAKERRFEIKSMTKARIDAFLMDEHERGMRPETIKKRLTAVRMFYQWAWHEGLISENPARFCQSPKGEQRLPKTANVGMIDSYLRTPIRSEKSARVHTVVALLLETGLRVGEAMSVTWDEVDMEQHTITVWGKGRKERIVFFGRRTAEILSAAPRHSQYVLPYTSDRRLREEMSDEVGRYVEGIHPHMLRHTFATALLNNGCPLKDVSVLMGHAHVTTTERYARVAVDRLQTQYTNYQI